MQSGGEPAVNIDCHKREHAITLMQADDGALHSIRLGDSCEECKPGLTHRKGLSFIDGRPSAAEWVEARLST
jgi:hypothetical protein